MLGYFKDLFGEKMNFLVEGINQFPPYSIKNQHPATSCKIQGVSKPLDKTPDRKLSS